MLLPPGYNLLADRGHRVDATRAVPRPIGATLIHFNGHRPCQRLLLSLRNAGPSWKLLDSWGNSHMPDAVCMLP